MTSEGLGEIFEGGSADMCAGKFPLVSMGGREEGLACTDPGARTQIGASGFFLLNSCTRQMVFYVTQIAFQVEMWKCFYFWNHKSSKLCWFISGARNHCLLNWETVPWEIFYKGHTSWLWRTAEAWIIIFFSSVIQYKVHLLIEKETWYTYLVNSITALNDKIQIQQSMNAKHKCFFLLAWFICWNVHTFGSASLLLVEETV